MQICPHCGKPMRETGAPIWEVWCETPECVRRERLMDIVNIRPEQEIIDSLRNAMTSFDKALLQAEAAKEMAEAAGLMDIVAKLIRVIINIRGMRSAAKIVSEMVERTE